MQEISPDKQQIVCSRSFSRRLTEYRELSEALAEFTSRSAEKLQSQQSVAGHIAVFIRANPFNSLEPQYQRSAGLMLPSATQDTRVLVGAANYLLKELFREGYRYHKCGVQLDQIQPASMQEQLDLFDLSPTIRQADSPDAHAGRGPDQPALSRRHCGRGRRF